MGYKHTLPPHIRQALAVHAAAHGSFLYRVPGRIQAPDPQEVDWRGTMMRVTCVTLRDSKGQWMRVYLQETGLGISPYEWRVLCFESRFHLAETCGECDRDVDTTDRVYVYEGIALYNWLVRGFHQQEVGHADKLSYYDLAAGIVVAKDERREGTGLLTKHLLFPNGDVVERTEAYKNGNPDPHQVTWRQVGWGDRGDSFTPPSFDPRAKAA